VRSALKPGGFFCNLVPTVNQVERLLLTLRRENFAFVEVCELLMRYYKPEPSRLRPTDRMVAHTGYLTFGRKIDKTDDPRAAALFSELSLGEEGSDDSPGSIQEENLK
jgi:tRNA (adenine57-N1/adenine58-N1)-methyltransferase catalytic subunit